MHISFVALIALLCNSALSAPTPKHNLVDASITRRASKLQLNEPCKHGYDDCDAANHLVCWDVPDTDASVCKRKPLARCTHNDDCTTKICARFGLNQYRHQFLCVKSAIKAKGAWLTEAKRAKKKDLYEESGEMRASTSVGERKASAARHPPVSPGRPHSAHDGAQRYNPYPRPMSQAAVQHTPHFPTSAPYMYPSPNSQASGSGSRLQGPVYAHQPQDPAQYAHRQLQFTHQGHSANTSAAGNVRPVNTRKSNHWHGMAEINESCIDIPCFDGLSCRDGMCVDYISGNY